MEEKRISPLKAIRLKCLDCSCGSSNEVKLCPVEKCPLYPFRLGKNPNREGIGNKNAVLPPRTTNSISVFSANSPSEGTYIPQSIPGETPSDTQEEKA